MKFNTLFESIITKQALNTQFHFTRLEDLSNAIQMQHKIADFYLAKLEKEEVLTPEQKKIFAGTLTRANNALKVAESVMAYASIGAMPEFKDKFEQIKSDVEALKAKVNGKIDPAFVDSAKTAQFKPQKAGVDTVNKVINPSGTDLNSLDSDENVENAGLKETSCDEVKEALTSKYARKFNTIKSFLNLRFAQLKRANKKSNPNIMSVELDFDNFCDTTPTEITYARPSEDYTKIQINTYPIFDALEHTIPVTEITQMYVDDEILDDVLATILVGKENSDQNAHTDKFNNIKGRVTNRFRR